MDSNFEIALELLGLGMLTVFLILFLVVFIGDLIIRFVNRYVSAPEVIAVSKRNNHESIPTGNMAAIVAAVKSVTQGKGHVVKVEKL